MTKEDRILLEGYRAAEEGRWAGENPYPFDPERKYWQDGWQCHRPANDVEPVPVRPGAPANDTEALMLVSA